MNTLSDSKLIIGAGGGGKSGESSGRVAQESPDSLRSKAYARVVDLVCEGEIEGLPNGLASVYLDETPIQNADGSYNFTGVTLGSCNGTQQQPFRPKSSLRGSGLLSQPSGASMQAGKQALMTTPPF